ncbi:methyltransferase domain-containing protein [Pseudomonadota bacterium]
MTATASPSSTSSATPCPVCTAMNTAAYVEKDGFKFLRCADCGYIFCHPRPTQAELGEHYAISEGEEGIRRDFYPKAPSRKRRGFFNALKLFPHVWGKRVLDLGCGGGFVAGGMKAVGAREALGLDINPNALEYARAHFPKCEFHCGTFDDFAGGKIGQFGFVYSSEVIEHVEDVEAYMRFLVEITEPGAKVFITTPDIGSTQVPENVTDWDVFSPPVHIQFFTEATLAQLFTRFGFTPIKRVSDRGGAGLKMLFRKTS